MGVKGSLELPKHFFSTCQLVVLWHGTWLHFWQNNEMFWPHPNSRASVANMRICSSEASPRPELEVASRLTKMVHFQDWVDITYIITTNIIYHKLLKHGVWHVLSLYRRPEVSTGCHAPPPRGAFPQRHAGCKEAWVVEPSVKSRRSKKAPDSGPMILVQFGLPKLPGHSFMIVSASRVQKPVELVSFELWCILHWESPVPETLIETQYLLVYRFLDRMWTLLT